MQEAGRGTDQRICCIVVVIQTGCNPVHAYTQSLALKLLLGGDVAACKVPATQGVCTAGSVCCVRAQGAICDYRPRLSAECGDLTLALEAGDGDRVSQGSGASGAAPGVSAALRVWRLEAVEHLPVGASEAAASEAALEQVPIPPILPQQDVSVCICLTREAAPPRRQRQGLRLTWMLCQSTGSFLVQL